MPGGPAYPGGLPQLADDGAIVFCVRDRGCTHLYAVAEGGGTPQAARRRRRRAASARSPSPAGPPRSCSRRATSFGEVVAVDLATGGETVRTRARRVEAERRALRARGARVHDLGRHRRARLADPRPRRAGARAAPARHPRRPAQRLERRRRRAGTSTTRSSRPAAGRCCCSTRAAATGTARSSTTPRSAPGARPTRRTSSSRSTSSSPRASPIRTGSRSPATATAAT